MRQRTVVICALALAAHRELATHDDAAGSKAKLTPNLRGHVPPGSHDSRSDALVTDVGLRERCSRCASCLALIFPHHNSTHGPVLQVCSTLMVAGTVTHYTPPGTSVLGYGARLGNDSALAQSTGLRLLLKEALCS